MAQGLLVTVTTGATVVAGSGSHGVIRVTLRNRGGGSVYLGGSDVTTAGFPLTTADREVSLTVYPHETLYATSTGSIAIDVLRMNETT